MISKIRRLFTQYCDHHFTLPLDGFSISDGDGKKLGHVDRISVGRHNVRLEGWSTAERVALGQPVNAVWQRPNLNRSDVSDALNLGQKRKLGFNLVAHGSTSDVALLLRSGATTVQLMLPAVNPWALRKANLRIKVSFAKRLLMALPTLSRAYLWPSIVHKSKAKHALGMVEQNTLRLLEERFFEPSKRVQQVEKLTLIMPVYNAFEILNVALEKIEENTELPWRMILVDDCSTDPRVSKKLRSWRERQLLFNRDVTLIENEVNLGFIGSINRAFDEALKFNNHVVIINSDALVPKDWARRIIHPVLSDPNIASVTPLSNDAEIFSVPFACKRSDLRLGEADAIDNALLQNLSNDAYQDAPTGVGFCMAMNRNFLQKSPQFDRIFGKGYGEEVDWCCRVSELGGRHVVQPNLYVEHRGGSSFGDTAKQSAIARNNQIVAQRYPKYDAAVQKFAQFDPIVSARIFAALANLSERQDSVDVYIAHSLGGGAELYLKEKIANAQQEGRGIVVLRLGGRFRWRIEIHMADGVLYGETNTDSLITKFLVSLPRAHIIYSCAVGDHDPSRLPKIISAWVRSSERTLTFLVHDYFAISPSYCLLDSDGKYRSLKVGSNLDKAHTSTDQTGRKISAAHWRVRWFGLLQIANSIECFSHSSAKIFEEAFPSLCAPIKINPHKMPQIDAIRRITPHREPSLGVLGDIGLQKGACCLQEIAKVIANSNFEHLTVIGQVDPRFDLGDGVNETGRYERSEITALAENHQIAAWLIPSIWPETFSYTTHEALATGLPVFCFDLGAQAEAVQNALNGHVLPLDWTDKPELILQQISKVLANGPIGRRPNSEAKRTGHRGIAQGAKSAS